MSSKSSACSNPGVNFILDSIPCGMADYRAMVPFALQRSTHPSAFERAHIRISTAHMAPGQTARSRAGKGKSPRPWVFLGLIVGVVVDHHEMMDVVAIGEGIIIHVGH